MRELITYFLSNTALVTTALGEHVLISFAAVLSGFAVAFPAGVALTKYPRASSVVLGVFSAINTIPSIVLLGVAMMVLGIGFTPAYVVLFLYSLLPILRNTYTAIKGVDKKYIKAARGMGMNRRQIMMKVQIPLALPVIIAGVRLSAIYIISWATLAAFIGAGGLGDLIWMGLQGYNFDLVLCGAIPATLLAFAVSLLLTMVERLAMRRLHMGGGYEA